MKSYKIKLLPSAVKDIENMVEYLSNFYPSTALNQYDKIMLKIEKLKTFPLMCEKYGTIDGILYRKLVVDDYLVFYVVIAEDFVIEIHRIINSKTDYSNLL
ncbi:MAG: type II toxin-antitoxin system RelE/ParE family toxin [Nitrososphaerota archaeon]|nr:type II toxin-antitoxin system RelE/ParE family toxin [Nitrososphaerota archaeon]